MEKRNHPRFSAQFNSYFSSPDEVEGLGVVTDMSAGGCRLSSETPVVPGTALRVRISIAENNIHIHVPKAEVVWVSGTQFGMEFKEMDVDAKNQLQLAIDEFERTVKPSQAEQAE